MSIFGSSVASNEYKRNDQTLTIPAVTFNVDTNLGQTAENVKQQTATA